MSIVCPAGATVAGIDVSQLSGTVDWAMVKSAGIDFAYARIADNTTPDSQFATNWSAMHTAGVVRGAYQFFHPGSDPLAQANYVVGVLGQLAATDLPVVVDLEVTENQSPTTIAQNLATFVDSVALGTGKQPVIFVGKSFWDNNVQANTFASDPLWIANTNVTCPNLPTAWTNWVVWLDATNATVAGVTGNVDHDKFNGSAADLAAFAAMTVPIYDDLAPDDLPIVVDAPPGDDANGQPATGKGGGCCDAGGSPDIAATLLVLLALGRRRATRARDCR